TADAPHVVNNSWAFGAPGCNLEFEPDLQALRAAGILPVFAAGNSGPNAGTSHSPANNPSAFAVGAINNSSLIYGLSSRGPTDCGASTGVFPELVAPGVNINTTDLGGFYTTSSGTSLAAPHVSGGLALLLSAYPNISAAHQQDALLASAVDLDTVGPDDTYGYGRLDLMAAYQWLATAPTETPAPIATATALPTLTATALPTNTATALPSATPTSTTSPANSTGWRSSTKQAAISSGGDGNGYETSAISAYGDDGLFAQDVDSGTNASVNCDDAGKDRHRYANYNISLPAGATVQGIEVRLDAKTDSTIGDPNLCVSLSWNAATNWSAWKNTSTLTTSEASYILGGSADTWGHNWTATELSNASFQVRITDVASDVTRDFSLDWIAVNVTYSSAAAPSATPSPTNIPPGSTPTATAIAIYTPTASATNSPSSPVYFSTYGNANPPGASGTADDADIYLFSGAVFSREIDASGTGSLLGLPSGANVDGFDRVDSTHFYLSFNGNVTVPGLGTVQDEDVLFYNAGTWSVFFDGTANGLSGTDVDAMNIVGGLLYFSTDTNTLPPGAGGSADDADIYRWNGGSSYTRVLDAAGTGSLGLPSGADIDGYVRVDAGRFYLSFNADVNIPGLGTVQDEDILYYDNGAWSVHFDGTVNGLTTSGLDVDAFDLP
ncbi:MAG: S8 family serine peptidase, partial [Chloroflexota bacterium]